MKKKSPFNILAYFILSVTILSINPFSIRAQSYQDSTIRKNIVRFDLTAVAWYNNAFNLSYERLIKNNQSLALTIGSQQLKGIGSRLSGEEVEGEATNASGFKIAAEYRFYLGKENRYQGPHGVYIGPYVAYHDFKNNWDIKTEGDNGPQSGRTDARIQVINMGFQAGYQFLINNRWSVDMSFAGLSMSHYRVRMNLEGEFDIDDSQINQDVLNALMDRFPLLEQLINEKNVDETGKIDSWGLGYRYHIGVGYAFGGGNKNKTNKKGNF